MLNAFALSLIVACFVGGAAGYLGSLLVTRRMALVGDALGHVALPGMGLALLLRIDPAIGAFTFLALGNLVIWRLQERTALSIETLVGIAFVSSLAVGFLIVPDPELLESLIGDISSVTLFGTALSIVVSLGVFLLVRRIYPGMMLLNISSDLAFVEGIRDKKYNLLYLSAIALIVSVGVKVTGSLLVGALVIIPAATARLLSTGLKQYRRLSTMLGILSSVGGILASRVLLLPAGPSIILVSTLIFLVACFLPLNQSGPKSGRSI